MIEQITEAIKMVWEKCKEIFNKACNGFRELVDKVYKSLIINDRFSYNVSKAFFSKKKRTRKKYMKRVFRYN